MWRIFFRIYGGAIAEVSRFRIRTGTLLRRARTFTETFAIRRGYVMVTT